MKKQKCENQKGFSKNSKHVFNLESLTFKMSWTFVGKIRMKNVYAVNNPLDHWKY
jgi:hypothetical protein